MKKLLLFTGLIVLANCSRKETPVVGAGETPTVAVGRASRQHLWQELVLTGELKPFQEVEVMSKVAGYVQRIYVDVGDVVRQGQVLAVLEIPEMKDDIARASAGINRNRTDLRRAADEIARAELVYQNAHLIFTRLSNVSKAQPGLMAQQEVDDARAKEQIAESQVVAAKSSYAAMEEQIKIGEADKNKAETLLRYSRITAPFDGVVTKRYANNGSMIQAGVASQSQAMPIVRLSQNGLLRLVTPVPESAAGLIHAGSALEVRVPSLKKTFQGKVARTANQVETSTRTMHTEIDVLNPRRELIPGMYAEITLRLQENPNAVAVPLTAVEKTGDARVVYVVNGQGEVERREVTTGLENPTFIEVRTGVAAGELVILSGRGQMQAGQKVKTKESPKGNT